jgi:hypothetical protein
MGYVSVVSSVGGLGWFLNELLKASCLCVGGVQEVRGRCFFIDSKGLVYAARLQELQHHKLPFAHDR